LAVLTLRGRVHLQDPALDLHVALRRDADALVAAPHALDVVVVGDVVGGAGELEHLAGARGDPVAAVGVAPGHRALADHLGRDVRERLAIFRGVPVEVVADLLPRGVVGGFRAHACLSFAVP
jgi:hypothetical protein